MRKSVYAVVLLFVVAAFNSGCLVLAATIIYVATKDGEAGPALNEEGWLEATLPYPVDIIRTATEQALEANALPVNVRTMGDSAYIFASRYGDDRDIGIELAAPTPYSTAVRIRVGQDGHLERSVHLMETIAEFAEPRR